MTISAITRARRLGANLAVILASISFVMELVLMPLSLRVIKAEFALSLVEISWFFNVYAISVAVSVLVGGVLGCIFDRRLVFVLGVVLFSIGTLALPLAGDLQGLLVGRTVQGVGGGIFSPFVPVLLARSFPRNPGRILMIWGGLAGLVATVSPLVAGPVDGAPAWRLSAWSIAAVSVFALGLFLICRPRFQRRRNAVTWDLPKGAFGGFPSVVFLYTFLTYGCFTFFLFYYPLRIESRDAGAGLVFATVWGSFSVLSFWLGARMNLRTLKAVLNAAPVLLAVGFVTGVTAPPGSVGSLVAAVLIGAGLACSNAPSTDLLLKLTPTHLHTVASSLDITFARLGGFFAVVLLAGLGPLWAAAAVVGCAALALAACRSRVIAGYLAPTPKVKPQPA